MTYLDPSPFQSPVRLYFAYSALIDRPTFERLWLDCASGERVLPEGRVAEVLDMDLALNCPSLEWGGRIPGLVAAKGRRVPGLLFAVDANDWPAIQAAEEHPDRQEIRVRVEIAGIELLATTFSTRPSQVTYLCPVSQKHLDVVVRGALRAGFSGEYVRRLAELPAAELAMRAEQVLSTWSHAP